MLVRMTLRVLAMLVRVMLTVSLINMRIAINIICYIFIILQSFQSYALLNL